MTLLMPRNPQNLFLGGQESNKGLREAFQRVDKLREIPRSRWEGQGAEAGELVQDPRLSSGRASPRLAWAPAEPSPESPRRPKFAVGSADCQRAARLTGAGGPGPGQDWTPPPGPPKQPIPGGRGKGPGRSLPTPPGPDHRPRRSAGHPRDLQTPCRCSLP